MSVCYVYAYCPGRLESVLSLGSEVMSCLVDSSNQIQVFWKSHQCSYPLSHLFSLSIIVLKIH